MDADAVLDDFMLAGVLDPEFDGVGDGGIGEFFQVNHRRGRMQHALGFQGSGGEHGDRVGGRQLVIQAHADKPRRGPRGDIEIDDFGFGDGGVG